MNFDFNSFLIGIWFGVASFLYAFSLSEDSKKKELKIAYLVIFSMLWPLTIPLTLYKRNQRRNRMQ